MAELSMSAVLRKILTPNIEVSADDAVRRAIARGITASEKSIRANVHTIKSVMRKEAAAAGAAKVAPSAARETTPPKAAPVASALPATTASTPEFGGVLANVALVNKLVGLCGGVENARQAADAVKACGGTDEFLQHLELVASIHSAQSAK